MLEKIKTKINEVIEHILSKDAKDITYSEFFILDSKLSSLKWEEEQAEKNQEMAQMMSKLFSFSSPAKPLPMPTKEE